MYRTDNPLADFANYEWEREKELAQRPICSECGEHIQEKYAYRIDGKLICEICMNEHKERIGERL